MHLTVDSNWYVSAFAAKETGKASLWTDLFHCTPESLQLFKQRGIKKNIKLLSEFLRGSEEPGVSAMHYFQWDISTGTRC